MAEETTLPAEHLAAAAAIKKLLAKRLLPNGQMLDAEVSVGVGLRYSDGIPHDALQITLKTAQADIAPTQVREVALKALSEIPILQNNVQFETVAEHAVVMRKKLEGMIEKGADIPKNYLKWGGFDPEKVEQWDAIPDHAIGGIGVFPKGIEFFVPVPENKQDQNSKIAPFEAVQNDFDSRKNVIKELLAQRLIKYNPTLDEAAKKQLIDKVKALTITIEKNEEGGRFSDDRLKILKFTISSPEQIQFLKAQGSKTEFMDEAKVKALTQSNPLALLSDEQRGKALGRSFLHSGDTSAVFPLIAGREDMKSAVIKSLVRLSKAKPELSKEVETFLNDDTFKDHRTWNKPKSERPALKTQPSIYKEPEKTGEMIFGFELPPGQAFEAIKALAAMDKPTEQAPMAKVEETAVGAITPAMQVRALSAAIDHVLSNYQGTGQTR